MICFIKKRFCYAAMLVPLAILAGCAGGAVYERPPSIPINLAPAEDANIIANTETTFVWQASADAEYYEFHIFDRSTSDIQKYYMRNLSPGKVCSNGQCSITLNVALPNMKDHAWRVRAGNYVGLSNWTRYRFSMVGGNASNDLGAPRVPVALQPRNATEIKAGTLIEFVWRPIPDATGYDFHLFDAVNAEMTDSLVNLPATTVCQGNELCRLTRTVNLQAGEGHAWRVRALNQNGWSGWTRNVFAVTP